MTLTDEAELAPGFGRYRVIGGLSGGLQEQSQDLCVKLARFLRILGPHLDEHVLDGFDFSVARGPQLPGEIRFVWVWRHGIGEGLPATGARE